MDKSFWNGSPWKKVDMISQFCFKFELLGKTQIIKQKDLEKPRLLSRLGQCLSLGRSRGFFLAPLFSVKPNSRKNKLKRKTQTPNFHGKTRFKFFRYQSLTNTCKPNSMLRIYINQVKMDKKRLNLTLRHFYWGLETFFRCNRIKHESIYQKYRFRGNEIT